MLSWKLWVGFALWEALGWVIGLTIVNTYSLPGGGFNKDPLIGAVLGMALLWWAVVFGVWAVIDYAGKITLADSLTRRRRLP